MNVEQLVKMYIDTRNQLSEERKVWEEREAQLKQEMEKLSLEIMAKCEEMGVDSFKTKSGTAFKTTKTAVRIVNTDEFVNYVRRTGNYQLFEKRVAKLAALELLEDDGITPNMIGLDVVKTLEIQVRK